MATTYKINGIDIDPQPTAGQWADRRPLGVDGNKKVIYPPTYAFELFWDALTQAQFKALYDAWYAIQATGVASATLPKKNGAAYDPFNTYNSVVIDEPSHGPYHQGYILQVRLSIRNLDVQA
jgi:hypothetical protein